MSVNWENLLIVANCKDHWKEFAQEMMYLCPSEPEAFHTKYKHFRAKYFAPYVAKGTKYVAHVDAVVRVLGHEAAEVVWNNSDLDEAAIVEKALAKRAISVSNRPPCLVFLLSGAKATDFVYDQAGGLIGSRQYFDVSDLSVESVADLANGLREVPWSGLPKYSG